MIDRLYRQRFYRHSPACPGERGHRRQHATAMGAPDKLNHDGKRTVRRASSEITP